MGKNSNEALLQINNLKVHFPVTKGLFRRVIGSVKAVDDVTLSVKKGETLGLVGESGCGKTTLSNCIMGLQDITEGEILYNGESTEQSNIVKMNRAQRFRYSEEVQIVFQDPYSALNPLKTVYDAFAEPLRVHGVKSKTERMDRIEELFKLVNLHSDYMYRYPHEFSGGQRQRICIARALCINPKLVVCDEPVSALDVSIQSQVLNLLLDLQEQKDLTYVFIAHDLSVVQHMSDRIAVMYLGKIVEVAEAYTLYDYPKHPYTQALLSAVPIPDLKAQQERIILKGDVPSPIDLPTGCRFHTRCRKCQDICKVEEPDLIEDENGHQFACHFPNEY